MKLGFIKVGRVVCFMGLAIGMLLGLSSIYGFADKNHSTSVFKNFYDMPKNTIDAAWIGPSSVHYAWITSEAYHETGLAMYSLATVSQPICAAQFMIAECEKRQDPSVYYIDFNMVQAPGDLTDPRVRITTSNMAKSSNWLNAVERMTDEMKKMHPEEVVDMPSHYFDFLKFHSRRDIDEVDFGVDKNAFLGFEIKTHTLKFKKSEIVSRFETDPVPVDDINMASLNELMDFCGHLDAKVVFVITPQAYKAEDFGMVNYASQVIAARGYEVVNFNNYVDDMNLDYQTDFKDTHHLNVYGAKKLRRLWQSI